MNEQLLPVEQLPRDIFQSGGRWLTLIFRQRKVGGAAVYLQNSKPGLAHGHKFHVIRIVVVDGKEQLGETLAIQQSCDAAMAIAGQAP